MYNDNRKTFITNVAQNNFAQRDLTTYESERSSIFNENLQVDPKQKIKHSFKYSPPADNSTPVTKNSNVVFPHATSICTNTVSNGNNNLMENLNNVAASQEVHQVSGFPNYVQAVKIQQYLELNLRSTNVSLLNESLFQKNQFLRSVDIRNNQIKELPRSLCDLTILWKLRLDYNLIEQLPENIGMLERLEVLTVSNNKLKKIPNSLFKLTDKLTMLQLNDNIIRTLPAQIGHLKNMKALLLHNNLLQSLPSEIFQLKSLQEFSLEWFSYLQPPVHKILKDERGQLLIKDFLRFSQNMYNILKDINQTPIISFSYFVASFNKLSDLKQQFYPKSRSVLHHICMNGHLHLLKELLSSVSIDKTFNLNQRDIDGTTPMTLALKNKQSKLISYLLTTRKGFVEEWLNQPIDLTISSLKYGLPLHLAIKNHDFKTVNLLIKDNSSKIIIDGNDIDQDGNNAIHVLMAHFSHNSKECSQIAITLIRKGIDINALNKLELTPLHVVIKSFQNKSLKFALDYNIHQLLKQSKGQLFDLNLACGKNLWNPLHFAVFNNNLSAVGLILQYANLVSSLIQKQSLAFAFARDLEFRQPQELCPYNSPVYKMIAQCQAHILKKSQQDIQRDLMVVGHVNIRRRTTKPIRNEHDDTMLIIEGSEQHQQQSINELVLSSDSVEMSRTELHYHKASSILGKSNAISLFQPIPPLAPKRLTLMPPRDMPNNSDYDHISNIRFMSHAVNFETENQRLNESGPLFVAARDLFNNSLDQHQDDSSSESDEERKQPSLYQSVQKPSILYQSAPKNQLPLRSDDFTLMLDDVQTLKEDRSEPSRIMPHAISSIDAATPISGGEDDDDDDICDAADEEPEAGALGQINAKNINKFENNQNLELEYKTQTDRDIMLRMVLEIREVKKEHKKQKIDFQENLKLEQYYGFQHVISSRSRVARIPALNMSDDGNVFDTVNQFQALLPDSHIFGKVEQPRIGLKQMEKCSKVIIVSHLEGGRGRMREINRDCNLQNDNDDQITLKIQALHLLFQDSTTSLKLQHLYRFYSQLFKSVNLFYALTELFNMLKEDEQSQQLVLIELCHLISATRCKVFIPFLEEVKPLKNTMIQYEVANSLDVLMNETLVQSRQIMDICNRKVGIERQRSRERMKIKRQQANENADLSDDSQNDQIQVIHQVSVKSQSYINSFSIREVPEFKARLHKSPSMYSMSRVTSEYIGPRVVASEYIGHGGTRPQMVSTTTMNQLQQYGGHSLRPSLIKPQHPSQLFHQKKASVTPKANSAQLFIAFQQQPRHPQNDEKPQKRKSKSPPPIIDHNMSNNKLSPQNISTHMKQRNRSRSPPQNPGDTGQYIKIGLMIPSTSRQQIQYRQFVHEKHIQINQIQMQMQSNAVPVIHRQTSQKTFGQYEPNIQFARKDNRADQISPLNKQKGKPQPTKIATSFISAINAIAPKNNQLSNIEAVQFPSKQQKLPQNSPQFRKHNVNVNSCLMIGGSTKKDNTNRRFGTKK